MKAVFARDLEPYGDDAIRPTLSLRPQTQHDESILVVDDEPHLRDSLNCILSAAGYHVCCAEGGRQALELMETLSFSLVLLDLNMPDISGQEVLDFINYQDIGTCVIIHSGEATFDQASRAMRKGAADFVTKPCPPVKLLERIALTLEKHRRTLNYRQIQQRMQDSRELHSFMIQHSPDLVFMLDERGKFSFLNDRSEYFLGGRFDELLGRSFSDFIFIEDRLKAEQTLCLNRPGGQSGAAVELRLAACSCAGFRHVEVWTLPVILEPTTPKKTGELQQPIVGTYGIVRDISDRKQAEELRRYHLCYHLYHDSLTNLPNRCLFNDRLQVAIRQARRLNQKLAVMFLDIDCFKQINDSLGHLIGDELLQLAAQKLRNCLREGDTLARISGDEFNLLLPNISNLNDAATIAEKIREAFSRPCLVSGNTVNISFSIGCAVYPDHGENKEVLLRNADLAMYQVKQRGRNGFHCYSKEMAPQDSYFNNLENELHQALENDELRLFYQPQIEMTSGRVVGVEALVRWRHAQRGLLSPAEFIPIAEHSDLVCRIDGWVLRQACRDAAQLKKASGNLNMAINMSLQQLESESSVQTLLATLDEFNVDPTLFEIEITENNLMQDLTRAHQTLSQLVARGITITVDDFGRGHSPLSYLHNLPLHKVKIDRSFMKSLPCGNEGDHSNIIKASIDLARDLNLSFIAKGVENRAQHDYLLDAGCLIAQGDFHSPPLSFSDLLGFLSRALKPAP